MAQLDTKQRRVLLRQEMINQDSSQLCIVLDDRCIASQQESCSFFFSDLRKKRYRNVSRSWVASCQVSYSQGRASNKFSQRSTGGKPYASQAESNSKKNTSISSPGAPENTGKLPAGMRHGSTAMLVRDDTNCRNSSERKKGARTSATTIFRSDTNSLNAPTRMNKKF